MTNYRIKQSPSGSTYRVEFQKETLKSKCKRFIHSLLFDLECSPYPVYRWCLLRDAITGDIVNFTSECKAQQIIDKFKCVDLDMNYNQWKIVDINNRLDQSLNDN